MTLKNHTRITYTAILVLCALGWTCGVFGIGVWDYTDGQMYAANAASMARDFQTAPSLDWEAFQSGAALGTPGPRINIGTTLLFAVPALLLESYRVWYGTVINFFFYLAGGFLFIKTFERDIRPWTLHLTVWLVFTNHMIWESYSRPLTDPALWFFITLTLYLLRRTKLSVLGGSLLLVFASFFRAQSLFFIPFLWLLAEEELTPKRALKATIIIGVTSCALLVALSYAFSIIFGSASGGGVEGYALRWYNKFFQNGVGQAFKDIHGTFLSLPSLTRYTPLIALFPASLFCVGSSVRQNRMRWFTALSFLLLTILAILREPISTRYIAVYLPYFTVLTLDFAADMLESTPRFRKTATAGFIALALIGGAYGPTLMLKELTSLSPEKRELTEPAPFEAALRAYPQDTVIAATTGEPSIYFGGRNIVRLPKKAADFIDMSSKNSKIDLLVVCYNYMRELDMRPEEILRLKLPLGYIPEQYETWASLLQRDTIIDGNGNEFELKFKQSNAYCTRCIYEKIH